MGKTSERCPRCLRPVPVSRSLTVPAREGEEVRGVLLDKVRYQNLKCPHCGLLGQRPTYVGRTVWQDQKTKRGYVQDCAEEVSSGTIISDKDV